jgi:5-formyltetrahydrofolate cyclo-ligase
MISKTDLRDHFGKLRANLAPEEVRLGAEKIRKKLTQHPLLKTAQKIGAYLPIHKELDLTPALAMLKAQGKAIFVPVLHPWRATFWFAPQKARTHNNKFGISEPDYQLTDLHAPWELDVVLVPLLAVDQKGHRLGMGKGFYDQSFAFKNTTTEQLPHLIGCAYHCQLSETELPHEAFDIRMDEVLLV